MTNTNNPKGATITGANESATFNALLNEYIVTSTDATPLYLGDFVKVNNTSVNGIAVCTRASAGDSIRGIVVSFKASKAYENLTYRPANAQMLVSICDDPNIVLEIQVNGTLTSTDIGKNADLDVAAGINATGYSGTQLDLTTVTTAAAQLKILSLIDVVGNDVGLYSKVRCAIFEHDLRGTSGSGVIDHSGLLNLTYDTAGHGNGSTGFQRGTTLNAADPTVNDDITAGYVPGDYWLNTTTKIILYCIDNTSGAAIWDHIEAGVHWQQAVKDQVDFTSAEPGSPAPKDRYINTATGVSSVTAQSVTATYIYEWNGANWSETVPQEGYAVWDEAANEYLIFNGTSWGPLGSVQSFLDLSDTPSAYSTAHAVYKVNAATNAVVESTLTCDDSGNVNIPGKLTVVGAIDPTALILDPQGSPPSTDNGTIYYDSGTTDFQFRENGAWIAQSPKDDAMSSGVLTGGAITDAGGATIDISSGVGYFRTTDSDTGALAKLSWLGATGQAIPSDTIRYVGVEYNAGSPQIIIKTANTWDHRTEFTLGSVANEAGVLHPLDNAWSIANGLSYTVERFYETQPFQRANRLGGLYVGETGTRYITLTAGELYDATNEFDITSKDTSGSDTFDTYLGGTAQATSQTQWDNLNYNNSGVLTALAPNKWANLWWYVEADDSLVMLYGEGSYNTSGGAAIEGEPPVVPLRIQSHGKLLGRCLFQQNAATATFQSVFDTVFNTTGSADHLSLTNLTTGDAGHTQFAALGGRSGGQHLYGGDGASDSLTLESTSSATKGSVILPATETLTVDTVTETTAANGVEVDGVLLKDGGMVLDFFPAQLVFGEASAAPAGWFHLNASAGTNVVDSSGFGRDLTTVNMVDGDWVAGLLNNCLQFAATKYAQASLNTDFDFDYTDPFSLECWVSNSSTSAEVIMSKMAQSSPNRGYQIVQKITSAIPVFSLRNNVAGNLITVEGSVGLSGGAWKHLVVTYDGSTTAAGVKIYVNSALNTPNVLSDTLSATTSNTTKFQVSGRDGTTLNYTGKVDEVVIYDRVVDQTFITARYNGGVGTEAIPGFSNLGILNVNSSTGKMSQTYGGDVEITTTPGGSQILLSPPSNGAVKMTDGNLDLSTKSLTLLPNSSVLSLDAGTAITPADDIIFVQGNGAPVTSTANPQITSPAGNIRITIIGRNDTNTWTMVDGNGVQLQNGQSFTFGLGDTMELIWDTNQSLYVELNRSDN